MKLQIMSDVHLDVRFPDGPIPGPHWRHAPRDLGADVLILAGDIGAGDQGVRWAAEQADRLGIPCVYVAGNHEYYYHRVDAMWAAVRAAAAGTRVHVLENESVVLDGVRFLGTTLWTGLTSFRPDPLWQARFGRWDPVADARTMMTDYQAIAIREGEAVRPLDPVDTVAWHREAVAFLERELARPFDGPTVVVTHHGPSELSRERRDGAGLSPRDNTYWTGLEYLFDPAALALWCHGHIHRAVDEQVNGVRLVSNPLGYPHQGRSRTGFDPNRLFEEEV